VSVTDQPNFSSYAIAPIARFAVDDDFVTNSKLLKFKGLDERMIMNLRFVSEN
jgi:hypothetical protein